MTTTEFPDIGEDSVNIERVSDYMIEMLVDGLPDGTLCIDYYGDHEQPRIIVQAEEIDVDEVHSEADESVWAISVRGSADDIADETD